jgi:hypothetical protein
MMDRSCCAAQELFEHVRRLTSARAFGTREARPFNGAIAMAARIYQRAKSSMQSGRARSGEWLLEFQPSDKVRPDPLTGWTGSADTDKQVRLSFPSLDAARQYAERQGIVATVQPGPERVLKIQAYADNFR